VDSFLPNTLSGKSRSQEYNALLCDFQP